MNHVCLLLPPLLRVSAWRLALICQVFPQLTASTRWVFLGPHLPSRHKELWKPQLQVSQPLSCKRSCDRAKVQQVVPKCMDEFPHSVDTKAIKVCVLVTPLTSLGPVSTALPLTISLHIFFSRGPGCLGVEKVRRCCKGPWTCYLLKPFMSLAESFHRLMSPAETQTHLTSVNTGGFVSHRRAD